ncbi:uncharacterized protein FTOL_01578 [Fusarium torulosum]|uniref:2EXR domain-containing protein n=1 Tax=Fusarium torulosum TaxID=33205 RepID=A0AAE8SDH6_9HYPO|nr:uncharacterized protein FTOL_01578 [Fusarium torulosum]
MSDLQTFHKFRELPPEIRRQIWAYALNTSAPRAYYVDVDIPSNAQPREVRLQHVSPGHLPRNVSAVSNIHCRATYLEAVSQEARIEVAHAWKMFKPEVPFTLTADSNGCNPSTIHGETSGPSGESVIVVDAANDLFIVEDWRLYSAVLNFLKADVNTSVDLPGDLYSGLESIKQISIPYKAVMFNRNCRRIIMHALAVFPNLRTLFIHLVPADLFAMNKGPACLGDVGHSVDHYSAPPWYFAAEERQDGMPFLTHTRDRIYYELCPKRVLTDAKNYRVCWGGFK